MRRVDEHGKYRYLAHEDDVKIQGFGKDLNEAFAHTALGMFNLLVDTNNIGSTDSKTITLSAPRITALLYDFLTEILNEISTNTFVARAIDVTLSQNSSGFSLRAHMVGEANLPEVQDHKLKSPTYTDMCLELDESSKSYHITVVIEI